MAGPLATLCWLPFSVRPWVFHVFTVKKTCYKQFSGYTFSQRFGLPQPLANLLAGIVSGYVSTLMTSTGAIPVYRGSIHIGATFKETVAALRRETASLFSRMWTTPTTVIPLALCTMDFF